MRLRARTRVRAQHIGAVARRCAPLLRRSWAIAIAVKRSDDDVPVCKLDARDLAAQELERLAAVRHELQPAVVPDARHAARGALRRGAAPAAAFPLRCAHNEAHGAAQ